MKDENEKKKLWAKTRRRTLTKAKWNWAAKKIQKKNESFIKMKKRWEINCSKIRQKRHNREKLKQALYFTNDKLSPRVIFFYATAKPRRRKKQPNCCSDKNLFSSASQFTKCSKWREKKHIHHQPKKTIAKPNKNNAHKL